MVLSDNPLTQLELQLNHDDCSIVNEGSHNANAMKENEQCIKHIDNSELNIIVQEEDN